MWKTESLHHIIPLGQKCSALKLSLNLNFAPALITQLAPLFSNFLLARSSTFASLFLCSSQLSFLLLFAFTLPNHLYRLIYWVQPKFLSTFAVPVFLQYNETQFFWNIRKQALSHLLRPSIFVIICADFINIIFISLIVFNSYL